MIIPLSFKQDEKWLYDKVKTHSGYSTWIKDTLKEKIENENKPNDIQYNQGSNMNMYPLYNENIM
jgi:hypothetical protein